MHGKRVSTTVYLDPEQIARLNALRERTKVPVAEFIRQALEQCLSDFEQNAISFPAILSPEGT